MMHMLRRWFVLCLAIGLLWAAAPGLPALAHAFLVQTSPQAGQRLQGSPRQLILNFTEALVPVAGDRVAVRSATGQREPLGPLALTNGGATLTASLPHLPNGVYRVDWSVVSAVDGHPTSGEYAFAVGAGAALSNAYTLAPDAVAWPEAMLSFLLLIGLAVSTGTLVSEQWIWRGLAASGAAAHTTVSRLSLRPALGAAAAGAGGLFLLFAWRSANGREAELLHPAVWLGAAFSPAGLWALGAFVLVLYAAGSLAVFGRDRRPPAALASLLLACIAAALRTHPAASPVWWAKAAIAAHIALAMIWGGMLWHLVWQFGKARRADVAPQLVTAVRRYAVWAIGSVAGVTLTGIAVALAEFTQARQLVTTPYGRVLLLKIAVFASVLALAGYAHRQAFAKASGPSMRRLGRVLRIEAGALAGVLAVSAVLAGTAPPSQAEQAASLNDLLGPPPVSGPALHLAGQAGWLGVYLTASRGQLLLQVVNPVTTAPRDVRLLSQDSRGNAIFARTPDGQDIGLAPRPCGDGCFSVPFHWPAGVTKVAVDATSRQWSGGRLTFAVPWPVHPASADLLRQVIAAMRRQRTVIVHEQVTSGPKPAPEDIYRMSGPAFMATEPYSARVTDIATLPGAGTERQLTGYAAGSFIWFHLWVDRQNRLVREVIIDPGHEVRHWFSYPAS